MRKAALALTLATSLFASAALAQSSEIEDWAVDIGLLYGMVTDITYTTSDGHESKLDVIRPRSEGPHPTLLYIHGGGWVGGNKEGMTLHFLPYLAMGYAVVNVEYRLADVALAPAAVADTRCALRWLYRNAEEYGFDTNRIVVSGHSAGGHLALTTGMLPGSAGFDGRCPAPRPDAAGPADVHEPDMPVAAIVNWFGITDVGDLVEGPNAKSYAVMWLGPMVDRMEVARRVSPLQYVHGDLPPILTIHGDADTIVPYAHGTQLHEAIEAAGGVSRLHTVPGGGHGGFSPAQHREAFGVIREFLATHVPDPEGSDTE